MSTNASYFIYIISCKIQGCIYVYKENWYYRKPCKVYKIRYVLCENIILFKEIADNTLSPSKMVCLLTSLSFHRPTLDNVCLDTNNGATSATKSYLVGFDNGRRLR